MQPATARSRNWLWLDAAGNRACGDVNFFQMTWEFSLSSERARTENDAFAWLEDIHANASLAWVDAQNASCRKELEATSQFQPIFERLLSIYNSPMRIPTVVKRGPYLYNFWQDEIHVRGQWRRTTLAEYRTTDPKWDILLDIDALARSENENWVWQGAKCLFPEYELCLVTLSRAGADSHIVREFDIKSREFVTEGFELPEAKGYLEWIDANTVYVGTDFGPGSLTDSGYPRIVKTWKRKTPLAHATVIFEGEKSDVSVNARRTHDWVENQLVLRDWIHRAITFYSSENYLCQDGRLIRLEVPPDANLDTFQNQLIVSLRSDWSCECGGSPSTWPGGATIATSLAQFLAGSRNFKLLFTPGPRKSLRDMTPTRHALILNELDDLRSRAFEWRIGPVGWIAQEIVLPSLSTIDIDSWDADASDDYFVTCTGPIEPTVLSLAHADSGATEELKRLPSFFDATGVKVALLSAISRDGTNIPYFVVTPKGFLADGHAATLLYGYGGFQVSILPPEYSAKIGSGWIEKGGVYVVAGLRGGGEFGPAWHDAAIRRNKHRTYEDMIAIALDLIARKITSPAHLGIAGGSNGGLTVAAVMLERPDLFKAVVCAAPLLDMKRYNKLLAGASWTAEYGDPDDPEDWAFIGTYSPYQNLRAGVTYPRILFETSTRDDRVHPGHARKMAAKMQAMGQDVLYYENIEGGHAGATNNHQAAYLSALSYAFLWQALR